MPVPMSDRSRRGLAALPGGVWALGFVSLFMDASSEAIHSLLPVFMVSTLGVSVTGVGVVEGIAEATASITKVFSGALSDYLGRRKRLALVGYSLAALTKPLFPLARSLGVVLTARFVDRIGKGIRGAPRDALLADITPPAMRGAAYGLRQALDTAGAFAGPLMAMVLMTVFSDRIRQVFWVAVVPAGLAVLVLAVFVRERPHAAAARVRSPINRGDLGRLGGAYWRLVAVATVLTLARFSDAFVVLRADAAGMRLASLPLVMVVMNAVYTVAAYPAGAWSDRHGRWPVLVAGAGVLVAADLVLSVRAGVGLVLAGVSLWGLHLALTQGLLAALVADRAPANLRGTAFGVFNLATGLALLVASLIAGWLWDAAGPGRTFIVGAAFAAAAFAGLLLFGRMGRADRTQNAG